MYLIRGGAWVNIRGGQGNLGGQGGSAPGGVQGQSPVVGVRGRSEAPWSGSIFSDKIVIELPEHARISSLKMIEKLILITLMLENTPYFLIFPFFEILRGAFAPLAHPPPMAPPLYLIYCQAQMIHWWYLNSWSSADEYIGLYNIGLWFNIWWLEINVTMRPSVKEVTSFIVFHNHVNVMI